jgi:hypothetical protein
VHSLLIIKKLVYVVTIVRLKVMLYVGNHSHRCQPQMLVIHISDFLLDHEATARWARLMSM